LEAEKKALTARGEPPRYGGTCRDKGITAAGGQVIRFKVSGEKIAFNDMIRGEISFDTSLTGDIAIAKNLRAPLYNFAVVVDDFEMKISHVIRGEDHIANTPKQILLQKALGFETPRYAHLPLILDPDRSKMSKRYSATSIQEYKKTGYLPEALFNFIALLGWHPKDEKEILAKGELAALFALERVQKAGAIFDVAKLNWMNGQYIKNAPVERLMTALEDTGMPVADKALAGKILAISKERLEKLSDFQTASDFFFSLPPYEKSMLVWKQSDAASALLHLDKARSLIEAVPSEAFSKSAAEAALMPYAEKEGRGNVLWPLRVALSGKDKSPGPFEIMDVLGREESLRRITLAISKFGNGS